MKLAGDGVFGFLSGTFPDVDPREALSFSTSLDGLGGFGNELDHSMVAEVAATVVQVRDRFDIQTRDGLLGARPGIFRTHGNDHRYLRRRVRELRGRVG